jgi:thermostable 8-oxoguanine DNA glycosylase
MADEQIQAALDGARREAVVTALQFCVGTAHGSLEAGAMAAKKLGYEKIAKALAEAFVLVDAVYGESIEEASDGSED